MLQKEHFFQFVNFFYICQLFFFIIYTSYYIKKFHAFTAKKNYTTRRFFCTQVKVFTVPLCARRSFNCRGRRGGRSPWAVVAGGVRGLMDRD